MIASKMQNAVNEQINAELYSAYLYLAMAAFFEDQNLKGMAHWMEKQAAEEYAHAKKFYDFIFQRGGRVTLKAIDAPPAAWKSPLDVFREAYAHEQKVTSLIYKLVELAAAEKDHAASVLLDWYVEEQVEEEASAAEIVAQLEAVKDSAPTLFMLDGKLGRRE